MKTVMTLLQSLLCVSLLTLSSLSAQAETTTTDDYIYAGMTTSAGYIELALNKTKAPVTVDNFITYVNEGFYNDTLFHRVIDGFMIQGGGYTPAMILKSVHPEIKNEAKNGLKNDRGTIAMARKMQVDSANSQFFINLVDNKRLNHGVRDYGYAVFGHVIKGMDVVDTIGSAPTDRADRPVPPILIESVTLLDAPTPE